MEQRVRSKCVLNEFSCYLPKHSSIIIIIIIIIIYGSKAQCTSKWNNVSVLKDYTMLFGQNIHPFLIKFFKFMKLNFYGLIFLPWSDLCQSYARNVDQMTILTTYKIWLKLLEVNIVISFICKKKCIPNDYISNI